MVDVAVIGLGKMGLSHLAVARAHPDVTITGVCDTSGYILDVLKKYTGVPVYSDPERMFEDARLDAVVVATPSQLHAPMVRMAMAHDISVFCEKPFTLDFAESEALAADYNAAGLVTHVGYHNRYVASFQEVKRLLELGAIGRVTHVLAEAYGPVILAQKGGTWRSRRSAGGGCLYDYAAHPVDLLTWFFGSPIKASGSILQPVFSTETDDEVYSTLHFDDDVNAHLSVSWSDESRRKMSTMVTIWGTGGRIYADRQEIQVYLRDTHTPPTGYNHGWNVRYTTELTQAPWFYLRGEEYSAQVDDFVQRVATRRTEGPSTFETAAATDRALAMIVADAASAARHDMPSAKHTDLVGGRAVTSSRHGAHPRRRWRHLLRPLRGRA